MMAIDAKLEIVIRLNSHVYLVVVDSTASVVARSPAGRLDVEQGAERHVGTASCGDAIGDGNHGSGDVARFLTIDASLEWDVFRHPGGGLVGATSGVASQAEKVDHERDGITGHWGGLLW
jgi:hypothetical protein